MCECECKCVDSGPTRRSRVCQAGGRKKDGRLGGLSECRVAPTWSKVSGQTGTGLDLAWCQWYGRTATREQTLGVRSEPKIESCSGSWSTRIPTSRGFDRAEQENIPLNVSAARMLSRTRFSEVSPSRPENGILNLRLWETPGNRWHCNERLARSSVIMG